MIAFEITSYDVQQAVKDYLKIELSMFQADRIFDRLDLQLISDKAAFESDGDGGSPEDDKSIDEATLRAWKEIVRQVNEKSLIN